MRYFLLAVLMSALAAPSPAADRTIDFNRDVRPILSDACFACHGFDAKARKAKLRLDTPEGAFEARKSGRPITPGKLEQSEIWARINETDEQTVMPPPHTNKKLTAEQKATIKLWIEQGAKYQKHWAFEPIRAAENPSIEKYLEAAWPLANLKPTPQADKETLIRRVAFTLTGLPPTVAEIDQFLADSTPQAYEKMVDRYLASPRYGEEMARHWLDVARYADTHGLHLDNEREMWAYRDWVIKAFNQNLSYDQFTVWQVAGDLLPEATQDQLIATGFNRCNVTTSEGGSISKEFVYRYAVERTSAVTQAWLGLTAGCAVCHDHKYDPISQKEFYQLYAFFNSAADPAMDGNINTTPPYIKVPSEALKKQISEAKAAEQAALERWAIQQKKYTEPAANSPKKPIRDVLFDDVLPSGATSRTNTRNATVWLLDPPMKAASGRRVIQQASAVGSNDTIEYKNAPYVIPHEAVFSISVYLEPRSTPKSLSWMINGKNAGLKLKDQPNHKGLPPAGAWQTLQVTAAELGLKPGEPVNTLSLSQNGGVAYWDQFLVSGNCEPANDPRESLAIWKKLINGQRPVEISEADFKDPKRLEEMYLFWIARPQSAEAAPAWEAWTKALAERKALEDSAPGTFIFKDTPAPRESFVMLRGDYDKPGEKVEPAGLAVLPPISPQRPGARLNRLDLAHWLVAPENPLTARVAVNRFWQQVFGVGIVKTSYDFGSQGTPPSHPELLDALASEFRSQGWDVKKLMKKLVLSEAFQRESASPAEVRARDPENRLLARGPRIRLDAEQIRDNALAVSGLLDLTMGGKGVKPYQPANIWEPVGYADSNTRFYLQDHGKDLYRRSIYIFLKRTAPPPYLSTFDAPNREQVCTVRERGNTPLQALQLMNDPQHFEAARVLAERVLKEGGKTTADRLTYAYRTVLARKPDPQELAILTEALSTQEQLFKKDPAQAAKVLRVGESEPKKLADDVTMASWTMICNLILNLDETVNRN